MLHQYVRHAGNLAGSILVAVAIAAAVIVTR
ncbi:hypothetical protein SAMN05192555_102390 [Franzmannia pantelleriensis]|uniref:Uncharacterized protein n=1 Tax=Franzmannia pantelleriensis TaxID=48727 RepID=A0A1G9H948_9GAMM|nr:hypothetical protein SAMN05192555_102390 [Halomonas pantelleriensis]